MKRLFFLLMGIMVWSQGCRDPYSNKRTSRIYTLNTECVSDIAWQELRKSHSTDSLKGEFLLKLKEFKEMPFDNEVYYFNDAREELIGVSRHEAVRYVYNPKISNEILDGLSPELSKKEKERIGNRFQSFLRRYQCKRERKHRYGQEWDQDKQ